MVVFMWFVLISLVHISFSSLPPICCFPDQFESLLIGDIGVAYIPNGIDGDNDNVGYGYGYGNGTVEVAYDAINERTYFHNNIVDYMSIYPIPIPDNSTTILDYKNNVQYRLYYDGSCDVLDVGLPLYKECIPGNATLLSEGTLPGSDNVIKNYVFYDRIYLDPYQIAVSVIHTKDNKSECVPVRASNSQSYVFQSDKNVDITLFDIVDFTRGIQDSSIFNMPPACKNKTIKASSGSRKQPGIFSFLQRKH